MDERIDSFLKGKMTIEEEEKFKAEIKSDSFLKQRASERLLLFKGMKVHEEKDEVVIEAAKKASIDDIYKSVGKKKTRSYWSKAVMSFAAAACIVIAAIGIHNRIKQNETLNYINEQSTAILASFDANSRGGEDDKLKQVLLKQFNNINNGDSLDIAIAALTPYFEQAINDEYDAVDNYAGAIGWFLTIAYYENNEIRKSIEIVNIMAETQNNNQSFILLKKLISKNKKKIQNTPK